MVRDDLARGQLAAPFGFVADGTGYHLLSRRPPEQDERDERVRGLSAWLRARTAGPETDPSAL